MVLAQAAGDVFALPQGQRAFAGSNTEQGYHRDMVSRDALGCAPFPQVATQYTGGKVNATVFFQSIYQ